MLIHVDTSILVDAFTEERRSLPRLHATTAKGDVVGLSTLVLYEWLRGPRTEDEKQALEAFLDVTQAMIFGRREAERAAALFGRMRRARQRQADIAIAACAIEADASLWTLNRADFDDIPGLRLL